MKAYQLVILCLFNIVYAECSGSDKPHPHEQKLGTLIGHESVFKFTAPETTQENNFHNAYWLLFGVDSGSISEIKGRCRVEQLDGKKVFECDFEKDGFREVNWLSHEYGLDGYIILGSSNKTFKMIAGETYRVKIFLIEDTNFPISVWLHYMK